MALAMLRHRAIGAGMAAAQSIRIGAGSLGSSLASSSASPLAAASGRFGAARCGLCSFPATPKWQALDYPVLEVWDTAEIDALAGHLKRERLRLHEVYRVAKEEQRKVVWKDAQFDLKRMDRLEMWIGQVKKDGRRTW